MKQIGTRKQASRILTIIWKGDEYTCENGGNKKTRVSGRRRGIQNLLDS
jgi:hypothetical protein